MSDQSPIKELEKSIVRYYEQYSKKRVATAAICVGVLTIGLAYLAYALTGVEWVAILVLGLVGVVSVYLSLVFIVPPSSVLDEACDLICMAIREPSRIKAFDIKEVKLADKEGKVKILSGVELTVWQTMVVPYFVQRQASGNPHSGSKTGRKLTASERKYIEERRREVLEIEKKINEERKVLKKERSEIESRRSELKELEQTASAKLAEAEAIDMSALRGTASEREAEFKLREAELEKLQEQIAEESKRLEARTDYVASVEDSLVEKLNELSEREAHLEQEEIESGVRTD